MSQRPREVLRKAAAAAAVAALLARPQPAAGAFRPRADEGGAWRLAGRLRTFAEKGRPSRNK